MRPHLRAPSSSLNPLPRCLVDKFLLQTNVTLVGFLRRRYPLTVGLKAALTGLKAVLAEHPSQLSGSQVKETAA